ncbi:MAG TPA: hypothetical protein VMU15_22050 [Anaeromyxobacter sp.]|nr:hypothetical protein [Anaeromyxobacter sp.]
MPRQVAIALLLVPLAAWTGSAAAADAPRAASAPAAQPRPLPTAGMTPDAAAQIPDAKKQEMAEESLKAIRKTVDRVAGRAEEARLEKDVSRLNCLNAQLTQMKGLQKVATQAREALVDAVGKRDPATANTQFARVVIASDKVLRMGGEADVCLGQLAYLVDGRTSVQMEQPEGLPSQDVTIREPPPPAAVTPPVVRPPPASKHY